MARSFSDRVRKHAWIIVVAMVIAFILLVLLGFVMGPDKLWEPPAPK